MPAEEVIVILVVLLKTLPFLGCYAFGLDLAGKLVKATIELGFPSPPNVEEVKGLKRTVPSCSFLKEVGCSPALTIVLFIRKKLLRQGITILYVLNNKTERGDSW